MENRVNVVISGEIFNLRSSENPDYMQRLARYVDQKMSEVVSKSVTATIDDRARTIILALNIADDYCKASDKLGRLDAVHKKFVAEMGRLQEENTKLTKSLKEAQAALERIKHEANNAESKTERKAVR